MLPSLNLIKPPLTCSNKSVTALPGDIPLNKLLEIYDLESHQKIIKNMNDDEILELGNNLKEGIPFATPVFDGVKIKPSVSYSNNWSATLLKIVLQFLNICCPDEM